MLRPTMTEHECRKKFETSPIRCLMERVVRRPYEMVPERAVMLMQMTEEADVEYAFTLQESAIVQIEDSPKKIVINLEEAERLWAALYAYASIFELTVKRGSPDGVEIPLSKAQGDWIWMEGLGWALGRRRPGNIVRWPDSLPKPENDSEGTVWKTNEWFVDVLGFMALHEFGHLASQHFETLATLRASRPSGLVRDDYLKMEFKADDWAAVWMAVAHAFDQTNVVNPDEPAHLMRLSQDLSVIRELARVAIEREFGVKSKRDFQYERSSMPSDQVR